MFLFSDNRELGVAFKVNLGSQASSRDDGGTSWFFPSATRCVGFLSSYEGELRESLVLPREVQSPVELQRGAGDCSRVTAGQIDLI